MNAYLRLATPQDAPRIAEIEKLCFPTPWTEAMVRSELEENPLASYVVLADDDNGGEVFAYAGFWGIVDEAHITNVAVHPDYRGQGWAKVILTLLIKALDEMGLKSQTLEVRPSNAAAIHLYESLGFREEGRRPGYYEGKEDAIIMWRRQEK